MPVIAHPPLACGAMDPKGADELIENLLDKLHLTPLLKVKSLFGQLMDKSLWFTPWPAIYNVSGQPSIALPVYVTDGGLPLGIQAAGRPGDEETLLSFAAQMEKISGWLGRRAPLMTPPHVAQKCLSVWGNDIHETKSRGTTPMTEITATAEMQADLL
eukprot:gene47146-63894_t